MDTRTVERSAATSWRSIFWDFARIGATSFGGGSATIAAMRQLCLRRGWLDEAQFVDIVVLSRVTPGISILAQALLIGRAAGGVPGMAGSVIGLLMPSIAITIGLAWLYRQLSLLPLAGAPIHAVAAVAAGFAVTLSLQFFGDLLRRGRLWRNAAIAAVYLAAAWVLSDPLLVMGLSILAALVAPALFDDQPAPADKADGQGDGDGL
jgi:chromate transport protein ChrA